MKNIKDASVYQIVEQLSLSKESRKCINQQYHHAIKSGDDNVSVKIEEARAIVNEGNLQYTSALLHSNNEKWIIGWEGLYSITTCGVVYSYRKGKDEMVGGVLRKNNKSRKTVLLCNEGKKTYYVSKLVAETFIHKNDSDYLVRFRDGDTMNCCVENLYYSTKEDFYADTTSSQLGVIRKPNTSKETDYILRGVGEKLPGTRYSTVISRLTEQDLIDAGIPPEYLNFSTKDESIWKAYDSDKALLEAIDAGYSIKECVRIVGVCASQVSSFKSGRRGAKQKAAYYKFKEYLKTVVESV